MDEYVKLEVKVEPKLEPEVEPKVEPKQNYVIPAKQKSRKFLKWKY